MNFTREPIIETIITPKDGYKLVVRNSKGSDQEEYQVDALEVVSFGHSFFFRSLERPKSFLVPVSDYEVIETKETRVVLKNVSIERSIKIGGGRQLEPVKEVSEPAMESEEVKQPSQEVKEVIAPKSERRKDRRRNRRGKRTIEERQLHSETIEKTETQEIATEAVVQGGGAIDETQVSSSMFGSLFPPPPTLISETINRYKEKSSESLAGDLFPQSMIETSENSRKDEELTGPVLTRVEETLPIAESLESESSQEKMEAAPQKERRRKKNEEEVAKEENVDEVTQHLHRVDEDDDDYFMI